MQQAVQLPYARSTCCFTSSNTRGGRYAQLPLGRLSESTIGRFAAQLGEKFLSGVDVHRAGQVSAAAEGSGPDWVLKQAKREAGERKSSCDACAAAADGAATGGVE